MYESKIYIFYTPNTDETVNKSNILENNYFLNNQHKYFKAKIFKLKSTQMFIVPI